MLQLAAVLGLQLGYTNKVLGWVMVKMQVQVGRVD